MVCDTLGGPRSCTEWRATPWEVRGLVLNGSLVRNDGLALNGGLLVNGALQLNDVRQNGSRAVLYRMAFLH